MIRGAFGKRVVIVAAKSGNRDTFNGFRTSRSHAVFVNANCDIGFVQVAGQELSAAERAALKTMLKRELEART